MEATLQCVARHKLREKVLAMDTVNGGGHRQPDGVPLQIQFAQRLPLLAHFEPDPRSVTLSMISTQTLSRSLPIVIVIDLHCNRLLAPQSNVHQLP